MDLRSLCLRAPGDGRISLCHPCGNGFGILLIGAQAEYLLVPSAQANLAKIPDELTDEQVVLLSDIASTRISGAEAAPVQIGDAVVVLAQGPIGLCATAGARLMGASLIIGVDGDDHGGQRHRVRIGMPKKTWIKNTQ